jgi:hypothetical protein
MRNSFLATLTLGAAVLSANAFGQVSHTPVDATPYDFSFKAGLYLPIDSNLRNVDNLFGGLGFEYKFPTQLIRGSETFLEVDAIMHTTASSNIILFPATLNQRFYSKEGSSMFGHNGRSYFYVGGGVTWIDPHGTSKFTGHVGVGSELGPHTFVEGSIYFADADNSGLRNTGVFFAIGYRY